MANVMCKGTHKETGEACDRKLTRCKNCGNEGCNFAKPETCSDQAFAKTGCLKCGRMGTVRYVKTED